MSAVKNYTRGTEPVQSGGSGHQETLSPTLAPSLMGWEMLNQ